MSISEKEKYRLEELELKDKMNTCQDEQRAISNKKYAVKLVEKIVFSLIALITVGVVGALINLVIRK